MAQPPLTEEDFITALVADPCDVPKLVVLKGFLGKGPVKNNAQKWRVYLNHALTDYYEGDDYAAQVLHHQKDTEAAGSLVWVAHGTPLRLVRTRASEAEVPRLLAGQVAQAHLAQAPPAVAVGGPLAGGQYAVPGPGPAQDAGWPPYDPGWEGSRCGYCYSASP